jgi:hypothetical protein
MSRPKNEKVPVFFRKHSTCKRDTGLPEKEAARFKEAYFFL